MAHNLSIQQQFQNHPLLIELNRDIDAKKDKNIMLQEYNRQLIYSMQQEFTKLQNIKQHMKEMKIESEQVTRELQRNQTFINELTIYKNNQYVNLMTNKNIDEYPRFYDESKQDEYLSLKDSQDDEGLSENDAKQNEEIVQPLDVDALSDIDYLSTLKHKQNSMQIIANMDMKEKIQYMQSINENQKPSLFPNERDNLYVHAKIIYLNENKQLLLELTSLHTIFADVEDIVNPVFVNEKCCDEADIYAINFKKDEQVIGDIIWDNTSRNNGSFVMKNIRKTKLEDVYIQWQKCSYC